METREWNALLWVCVRAGEVRKAEELLAALPTRSEASVAVAGASGSVASSTGPQPGPDAKSFNTVLHAYVPDWAGGESFEQRVARAEVLLERMAATGVARDDATYRALVDLHQYDAPRVLALLSEAESAGCELSSQTYGKVARSLWWARRADEASSLSGRMVERGVEPSAAFYARSIVAAESVGLLDDADRLHREASQRGLQPRTKQRRSLTVAAAVRG